MQHNNDATVGLATGQVIIPTTIATSNTDTPPTITPTRDSDSSDDSIDTTMLAIYIGGAVGVIVIWMLIGLCILYCYKKGCDAVVTSCCCITHDSCCCVSEDSCCYKGCKPVVTCCCCCLSEEGCCYSCKATGCYDFCGCDDCIKTCGECCCKPWWKCCTVCCHCMGETCECMCKTCIIVTRAKNW